VNLAAPSRWSVKDTYGRFAGILHVDELVAGPYGIVKTVRWHWAGGRRREDDPVVVRDLLTKAERIQ
jgi:hypothetical protein